METSWILIANSGRARCFERHAADHSLTELSDFMHLHASLEEQAGGGDLTGAAGKGHGRTGHAGTQFEPHTQADAKERADFARQLADYLNEGVAGRRCDALVLIATSTMLGELRPCLSHAAEKAVKRSIVSDLTRYQGADLRQRVNEALQLPD